jgi:anti-sigma B factor antagonist
MELRERHIGAAVCLDVEDRLVVMTVEDGRLIDRVNSLLLHGHRQILLNLKEVSQIDTTGLATITALRRAAEREGAVIKLVNLPPRIHNLLVITKLITLFDVFDSEAEAARSFDEQRA